jgi:hypothetical protein
MTANGGSASVNPNFGQGGGGRIAIYYTTLGGDFATPATRIANFRAFGGFVAATATSNTGDAGTVFLKGASQTYGDLIVNNNNNNPTAPGGGTWLYAPLFSTSSALTSTLITSTGAFSSVVGNFSNFFKGFFINPNTAQNASARLDDDTVFEIQSNTANALTTTSGVTSVASSGNTFRMQAIFDNLEVRGRARLIAPGVNIQVLAGDLGSDNTTTFSQDGHITANTVDLGPGVNWNTTANTGGTVTTRCASNHSCP